MIPGNPPASNETSLEKLARAIRALFEGGVGGPSPGASTDNALARWDGTDGRTIQDSTVTASDTGGLGVPGVLDVTGATTLRSTVDVLGVFKAVNQPGFSANKGGTDQAGIVTGVFTKLTFGTEEWDIGGFYDAANSKWTPPAGKVLITAGARQTVNVVDGSIVVVTLYKDGSRYRDLGVQTISETGGGNTPAVVGTIIESTDGTHFYEIYFFSGGAGNKTVSGSTIATFFQGELLR